MTSSLPRLAGRVALVTGGGSGLGYATVERFVTQGTVIQNTLMIGQKYCTGSGASERSGAREQSKRTSERCE